MNIYPDSIIVYFLDTYTPIELLIWAFIRVTQTIYYYGILPLTVYGVMLGR